MFVIRQATADDLPALTELAAILHRGGLPPDPEELARRVVLSRESFAGRVAESRDRQFWFALEDTDAGNVVGLSVLRAAAYGPGSPLTYLLVRTREHYSEDLRTGQLHTTVQLQSDDTPAGALEGLILAPPYRGHRERLGELLSLVRFHLIGLHRAWFCESIVTELPPASAEPAASLWEHLGRRFVNLPAEDAERFRARSHEFVTTLFPRGEIYLSLLPPAARAAIGSTAPGAARARALLERLGLACRNRVEPFGGGPILDARLDGLAVLARSRIATLGDPAREHPRRGLVSLERGGQFRAVRSGFAEVGGCVSIPGDAAGLLGAQVGDTVGVTAL